MKLKNGKFISLIVLVCLVWVCILFGVVTYAASSPISGGSGIWVSDPSLTYSYSGTVSSSGSNVSTTEVDSSHPLLAVSVSGDTLTITANSSKYYSQQSGCSTTNYDAGTVVNTVTVTNDSDYPVLLNTLSVASGSATISGAQEGGTIPAGGTFTITVTAVPASSTATSATTSTAQIKISATALKSLTMMAIASPYVSYTIEGKTVAINGADVPIDVNIGSAVSLPAITSPSGYQFVGWRVGSSLITTGSFTADNNYSIYPVILPEGTDTTSNVFQVGNSYFHYWEDAMNAAATGSTKTVALIVDHTLPDTIEGNTLAPGRGGDYVKDDGSGRPVYLVPAGVTFLVPYDSNNTVLTTTSSYVTSDFVTPTEYRRLTLPAGVSIVVDGGISVGSQIHAGQGSNVTSGAPTGPHGRIEMSGGSNITVNSGGAIYAYGYITGGGTINANSGATIHECFQMCEFGGGSRLYALQRSDNANTYKVFPFSQYYAQTIESAITFVYGSKEILHVAFYIPTGNQSFGVDDMVFIGPGSGLFSMGAGSVVTKQYLPGEDRLQIDIYGDSSVGGIQLSLASYNFSSSDYTLPINGNMTIRIHSGTTTIGSPTELLPGAELYVAEGAALTVSSKLFVYDSTQWLKATNGASGTGSSTTAGLHLDSGGSSTGYGFVYSNRDLVASQYSPTRQFARTADQLTDAVIDVNGTLNVTGHLNTTTSGARIISSEGTGKVVLSNASAQNLYQFSGNGGGSFSGYVYMYKVGTTAARLKNGDAYEGTDSAYVSTAAGGTGTYYYDATTQKWYKYKVEYKFGGATVYTDYIYDGTSTWTPAGITPTAASATNGTASVSEGIITVTGVTADSTVTISGDAATFTPYFVLNAKQYALFQKFTGETLTETATVNGQSYYIVSKATEPMSFGVPLSAPTDAEMGITAANGNSITWRLADSEVGAAFADTVPEGENGASYIYGQYSGYVASVTTGGTTTKYRTLEKAFDSLSMNQIATITMINNCGTFEDEDATATLSTPAGSTIIFDLAGYEAWGSIINNGVMTIDLNGGVLKRDSAAEQTSASQTVFNIGTMTIQNSGSASSTAGVISNNSWRASSGLSATVEYFQAVVRNSGENAVLTIGEGVILNQSETGLIPANNNADNFVAVGIVNINEATIEDCKANIDVENGAAIYNFGAIIKSISGGNISAKQGIYNRNRRTATGVTPLAARIDSITNVNVYVTGQFAIYNRAIIGTIGGSASFSAANYTVYSIGTQWYYDSNLKSQTDSSSNGYTRTQVFDTTNIATIDKITDSVSIIARASYALDLENGAILNELSGAVTIEAKTHQAIRIVGQANKQTIYTYSDKVGGVLLTQNTAYFNPSKIGSISGSGMIIKAGSQYAIYNCGTIGSISGDVILSANIYAIGNMSDTTKSAYSLTNIYTDNTNSSTRYKITEVYTYNSDLGSHIGEINGVTINASGSNGYFAISNHGYIASLKNVTISADTPRSGEGAALVYNGDSRRQQFTQTRTTAQNDSGIYITTYEYEYVNGTGTSAATIDSISGCNITKNQTYCLRNLGYIGSISNSTISATQYALVNTTSGPYSLLKQIRYYSGPTAFSTTRSNGSTLTYWYERAAAEIGTIDGCTISTTSSSYAMYNGGHIGTISNNTISSKTSLAIYNGGSSMRSYDYNLRDIITYTDTGTASLAYSTAEGAKKEYYVYDVPVIDLIGSGNTITATEQAIANLGTITEINGGSDPGTIQADASGKIGLYNYKGIGKNREIIRTVDAAGTAQSTSDTYSNYVPASIGAIKNTYIEANGYGIQNGSGDANYDGVTINEIGAGAEIKSTGSHAVYNASSYATIGRITGGIYTATVSGKYAVYNGSTNAPISITAGDFKGGTADRAYAILEPDTSTRQTYPATKTLSGKTRTVTLLDGTTAAGYYYIKENTFVLVFNPNGGTGSLDDNTISRLSTSVVLPEGTAFNKPGSIFAGWSTNKDKAADDAWLAGETITLADLGNPTVDQEITLYAIWRPNTIYSITVTWTELSFTYHPAVYKWDGANLKYNLEQEAYWESSVETPGVTVTNNEGDDHGSVTAQLDFSASTAGDYSWAKIDFTVDGTTTQDSVVLSNKLDAGYSKTAAIQLTGTPTGSSTNQTIGTIRLTLMPATS